MTLLDVLEHVDDTRALAEARRVLRPGGLLLITVPAMPWLWSYRDRAAGHRRRYTRSALRRLAEDCGFEVAELRYYQCALLPLVAASRLGGRRNSSFEYAEERPPRLLNELFSWINGAEARLHADLPWGTSLAAAWHRSGA
jgi:SAM-dependent methyltransferase